MKPKSICARSTSFIYIVYNNIPFSRNSEYYEIYSQCKQKLIALELCKDEKEKQKPTNERKYEIQLKCKQDSCKLLLLLLVQIVYKWKNDDDGRIFSFPILFPFS